MARRKERDGIDWEAVAWDIKRKMPLRQASRECGLSLHALGKYLNGYAAEPRYSNGCKILALRDRLYGGKHG